MIFSSIQYSHNDYAHTQVMEIECKQPLSLISTIKSMITTPGIDTCNLHFPLVRYISARYISLRWNPPKFDKLNEY